MELVCCIALKYDALVCNYLTPLALHPLVTKIWIVRDRKPTFSAIPKSEYCLTPESFKPLRWWHMFRECRRLAHRPEVKACISFNPVPYGLIAQRAARPFNKKMHFGFIGSDWYRSCHGVGRSFLLPRLRKADFFTATGQSMKSEMVAAGFPSERIAVLPHTIDLDRIAIANDDAKKYCAIFVGQLITRKRVDILLRAYADVLKIYPDERFCIVGDGPERNNLEALADQLGIKPYVEFTGAVQHAEGYMQQSRMITMASDMEGFPFALAEGMCSGLIPISTPVGTISELIHDGTNGFLVPQNDPITLAHCITRLMNDQSLSRKLRNEVLRIREHFSPDRATAIWGQWLNTIENHE